MQPVDIAGAVSMRTVCRGNRTARAAPAASFPTLDIERVSGSCSCALPPRSAVVHSVVEFTDVSAVSRFRGLAEFGRVKSFTRSDLRVLRTRHAACSSDVLFGW
ncbi:hypothetical protein GCM10009663_57040 [Kitasatospora arboriphila]|uniref:Uncharacterized protein n=1 Tax=Kitasatospora arboriphila TaxID=258052 RepID=A0ABP4EJ94_9ACTN